MLSLERLNELKDWENEIEHPTIPQMILGLLMAEMREMAREIIQLRASLTR